ncbi:MAG: YloN [Candidatus Moranbacteria bacterium GW2011_GWE2_35_2-]|nr:MAG: YloN [Candidatus Moranbacteria bacterium GW2011_GWE2_35_2-]KKQ22261.1 MAG: YloN [Candidatus Moranbacteria bacterium GW2011_GWF2_37_11]KKQ28580.1 MAG: YloN [Candidatus Moranbacteria bacterium GW2011_GWD1_37_17]KKQ30247.1 MAG: YloN [Candidatus Moranbacteria bacterium GW2011_GWE1_37_24]KKQ47181.1 MAG: YloN [Candidatus Moranbacteria bacterium GW2011_GWD2_37_9]HBO16724.1 23S rRNA (adenine(2503)-C(2))-methyltransferase RlmN [Candidatus Moranbacteria bacterium]
MDIEKLEKYLGEIGEKSFRIKQIRKAVFVDGISSFEEISTLSKELRKKLDENFKILSFSAENILEAKDGQSVKALLELSDGNFLETVLISPKPGDWSVCVSTQVGCAMGCRFCATGKMGFKRNLTAEEITDQVLFWRQYLNGIKNLKFKIKNCDISNVVYMGMGEPFNNWKEVSESIRILTNKDLFAFGSRSISVSTSGIAEGIEKLASEFPQVNLAISLHFANDKKRDEFMPVNKKDNLESLKIALQKYFQKTKRKVFVEYILLEDANDTKEDAQELARYLKSIGNTHLLHVNLIGYNTTSGDFRSSSGNRTHKFKEYLLLGGINATIRKSLGEEIKGACGQLATR